MLGRVKSVSMITENTGEMHCKGCNKIVKKDNNDDNYCECTLGIRKEFLNSMEYGDKVAWVTPTGIRNENIINFKVCQEKINDMAELTSNIQRKNWFKVYKYTEV